MVLPGLSRLGRPAVLASGDGRVIASNTASILPGMVLSSRDADRGLRPVPGLAAVRPGNSYTALPWTLHSQG